LKLWPWLTVIGMTLSLYGLFSVVAISSHILAATKNPRLVLTGMLLLFALNWTFWFPMLIVSLNIVLWAVISYWRIKSGDVAFNPFLLKGFREEVLTFAIAFTGLWLLNLTVKLSGLQVHTFRPERESLFWAFEGALFGSLEEITWRAYVLNAIGGVWGLLASAFGFGLHHLGSSWQHALYAFIAGLILGGVYMKTGAFWGVFFAHGLYNFTATLLGMLTSKGGAT